MPNTQTPAVVPVVPDWLQRPFDATITAAHRAVCVLVESSVQRIEETRKLVDRTRNRHKETNQ